MQLGHLGGSQQELISEPATSSNSSFIVFNFLVPGFSSLIYNILPMIYDRESLINDILREM